MTAAEQVITTARAMNTRGLNVGTAGNVSTRIDDGMAITASGVDYSIMTPDDVVMMRHDTTWQVTNPTRRPSSEWRFHLDIYAARPDVTAVVHAHPQHATAVAVHGRGLGPFHYMVGVAGGRDIRCAPYATFGTQELSQNVVAALDDRNACLIEHHGIIALGTSPGAALDLAVEVELLAAQYITACALGPPPELTDAQMNEVLAKMASPDGYGSAPPSTRKKL